MLLVLNHYGAVTCNKKIININWFVIVGYLGCIRILFFWYNYFMKLCVIPIDNRPVCYNLIKEISRIDKTIELYIPPRHLLGSLTKNADIVGLYSWLCKLPEVDSIVVSLDTIAYGGLIPSRRCPDSFSDIKSRMLDFKEILETKKAKIYAVSSIMRISNNNCNEEEKEYWDK